MKILLATIPHTGTYFFKALLEDNGFDVDAFHLTDDGLKRIKNRMEKGDCLLVTTYRNFEAVNKSWTLRRREGMKLKEYMVNWYRIQQYEPVIVSVDNNKEVRLELLEAVLGKKLETDWEPVNVADYAFAVDSGYQGTEKEFRAECKEMK